MTVALFAKPSLASQVARLFARGEQGAWYDPSDLSTLFQDAAGTTPVTGVEQPVGRMLDKSGQGNHATQATATSRPVLSGRYNLQTGSQMASGWVADGATPPSVTNSALYLGETCVSVTFNESNVAGFANSRARNSGTFISVLNTKYVASFNISLSRALVGSERIDVYYAGSNGLGVIPLTAYSSPDFVGRWNRGVTQETIATVGGQVSPYVFNNSASALTAPVTVYINKVDIRVGSDGIGLPPYQRVNTNTDYDTVGFPLYLACDGVDDGMATGSIDFTGTDKLFVAASARLLASSPMQILLETSTSYATKTGAFELSVNEVASGSLAFARQGSTANSYKYEAPRSLPITVVFAGQFNGADQLAASIIFRVNGSASSANPGGGGTGSVSAFGNYPLYLFRRSGVSGSFNGRFYGAVIRGAESTEAQIRAVERYLNSKTRAW